LFLCNDVFSAFSKDDAGTTGAQVLKFGIGARAIAMGEAYTAIAEDADAIYWNPAGITQLKRPEAMAMYTVWFEDIRFANTGCVLPFKDDCLGISIDVLFAGIIDMYDRYNRALDEQYMAYDGVVTFSYAKTFKSFMAGMNIKHIYSRIEEEVASAWGFDFGLLRNFGKKFKSGLVVKNLGTGMKYNKKTDPLPTNIKAGVSYEMFNDRLLLAADAGFPIDNSMTTHYGAEYRWPMEHVIVMPRIGYKKNSLSEINSKAGLSIGIGLKHRDYSINCVWVPYWELGNTYRISANFRFGKSISQKNQKALHSNNREESF
jgi:hypothetical protein